MKIDKALSLDCYEVVDAEQAYDYYWSDSGKIKDKRNFECASEQCNARITCANLYRLRQDMIYNLYFKAISDHSNECDLHRRNLGKTKNLQQNDQPGFARTNLSENLPDIFEMVRPPSHYEYKEITDITNNSVEQEELKRSRKREVTSNELRSSRCYTVRQLVSKYFRYKQENKLSHHYIKIKGINISYAEMFVKVKDQEFFNCSQYPRIYFGKAFVNQVNNKDDYFISFSNSFRIKGIKIRPSTYISKDMLEKAFTKRLFETKIKELSQKNYPAVYCFVYSKPTLKKDKYINLNTGNMDYFDMREDI